MLREVGFERGRPLFMLPAAEVKAGVADLRRPFAAFIALDARERGDEDLRELARTLIDGGCVYSVTWGPEGGRMDLSMDRVTIDKELASGLKVGELDVMTVDGQDDPLAEALWCAVYLASAPYEELTAVVAVVDEEFSEQIERYLADTARLVEEYEAIDDARVAAEATARRRGWIQRLWVKLAGR
jgi:hypothetical protein